MICDKQKVAYHERLAAQGGRSLRLEHYLGTLLRKPGALAGSVALQQVPHLIKRLYDNHFSDCPREFLEVLQYAADNNYSFRDITDAAARLKDRGLRSLCRDQLKAELHSSNYNGELQDTVAQDRKTCHSDNHKPRFQPLERNNPRQGSGQRSG